MQYYPYFIKNVPVPQDGYVTAPEGPGLRVEFRTEPFEGGGAIEETTAELWPFLQVPGAQVILGPPSGGGMI